MLKHAAVHVGSSKITQGTTRIKHTLDSRAQYLQEYISFSTGLHASVHWPRTVRGAGLHAQGLGGQAMCANLVGLSLGNGILLPLGWLSKL